MDSKAPGEKIIFFGQGIGPGALRLQKKKREKKKKKQGY